jgi:nicotinamide mononucleotide adenylyltransferase
MKKAHVCFGRFQPPHIGHARLFLQMTVDGKADCLIYPSHSYGGAKNPLTYSERVKLLREVAKKCTSQPNHLSVVESDAKDILGVLKDVEAKGYTDVVWYSGSDRAADVKRILGYNGTEFNFESISCKSLVRYTGTKYESTEYGMSGSTVRNYIREGATHDAFLATPPGVSQKTLQNLVNALKK